MKIEAETTITLILSEGEAQVLATICGKISGHYDGPRGVTDRLQEALVEHLPRKRVETGGCITLPDTWEEFARLPSDRMGM